MKLFGVKFKKDPEDFSHPFKTGMRIREKGTGIPGTVEHVSQWEVRWMPDKQKAQYTLQDT